MQTLKDKAGVLLSLADDGHEHGYLNAELVLGLSGGYVGVCMGIDIGVDAECYVCGLAQSGAALGNYVEFGLGLYVEAGDTCVKSQINLTIGLADSGKYYG